MPGFGDRAKGKTSSSIDLGPPRFVLRERATRGTDVEWTQTKIWCKRCLARKDHKGRWRGGVLYLKGEKRQDRIIYCDCALGQRLREVQERLAGKPLLRPWHFADGTLVGPHPAAAAADPDNDGVEIIGPLGEGHAGDESPATAREGRRSEP